MTRGGKVSRKNRNAKKLAGFLLVSTIATNQSAFAESNTVNTGAAQNEHAAQKTEKESAYRLPDFVVPSHYELSFEADAPAGKFSGQETIVLELKKAVTDIVLNGTELTAASAELKGAGQKQPIPLAVSLQKNLQRISFHSAQKIQPGKYELSCSFKGILNDKLRGFYRSTFKDKAGKTHYLAVTQMEPADARRMFPCFDEPAFKASFKIKAIVPAGNTAISNAAVEKESFRSDGKKVVIFEKSPPMSTYLLALLIGEFKPTAPVVSENVAIRVWSAQHDPSMGNYARDNAAKLLTYLNGYFRIPYPWKKLDLIAIPDFQAGAMENPGAITFREKFLMLDEKAALSSKQSTVAITAHEMAHLWFGDLVTMKWWDDIWLNEAFATWMATKAVNNVAPEWNVMAEFFANRLKALYTDSLHSTRSIQSPVVKPEDAEQMFDEITYVKGAAVLRMLEHYLGEKTFQDGVSNYLKEHSFANASTNDLWKALQEASQKPVKEVMDSWCKQPGYPLVTIKGLSDKTNLSQERFFLSGEKSGEALWKIPVSYRVLGAEPKADSYGREEIVPDYQLSSSKRATLNAKPEAVYANAGGFGFYRTLYDDKLDQQIASNLRLLSPVERLCFLNDHLSLAIAGKMPVQRLLEVMRAYNNETEYAVWETLIAALKQINRIVEPNTRPAFSNYIKSIVQNEYHKLGWASTDKNEAAPTRLLRGQIIGLLGTIGQDKEVISKAREKFAQYLNGKGDVDSDLLDGITDVVAYNGSAKDLSSFKSLWKKAASPEVEQRALYAMAKFRQPELVQSGLSMTVGKEVRAQDAPKLLAEFFNENDAKLLAWGFLKTHWTQIQQLYAPHMLSKLAESPATLNDEKDYSDVKAFFETHKVPEGASSVSRMLEKLKINVQFKQRSGKELNKWLQENN